jgi:hypothetical protein
MAKEVIQLNHAGKAESFEYRLLQILNLRPCGGFGHLHRLWANIFGCH